MSKGGALYGRLRYRGRLYNANRLAWELTHGQIPDGLLVCHKCDTPLCVRPDHLFLGTTQENMADRDRKGRQARGERMNTAKLKPNDVHEIRRLAGRGMAIRQIAGMFPVQETTISAIVRRKIWRHL